MKPFVSVTCCGVFHTAELIGARWETCKYCGCALEWPDQHDWRHTWTHSRNGVLTEEGRVCGRCGRIEVKYK